MIGGDRSPSSVAYATNCLQLSSTKGKPFCKTSLALHNKATRRKHEVLLATYLSAIYSLFKVVFAMYARRKEGFPSGGSWRRRRLMRGDQSPPAQRLQSLTLPTRKTSAIAARCNKSAPPIQTPNFPREHPLKTKRIKSLPCKGGCAWGKFSVREGGLEGESPVFQ